jgi:hypothetical protein
MPRWPPSHQDGISTLQKNGTTSMQPRHHTVETIKEEVVAVVRTVMFRYQVAEELLQWSGPMYLG